MNANEASDREVLTVEEASHLLGIGSNAVYDAVKRGEIPSIRIGRRIVIPKHKLNELLGKQPPQSRFPAELEATVRHLAQETQLLTHVLERMTESIDKLQAVISEQAEVAVGVAAGPARTTTRAPRSTPEKAHAATSC